MPRTPAPAALACLLLLTGCSLLEEPEPEALPPSVISPDRPVSCEERDDCGEAGTVRWSVPLEGEYYVRQTEETDPSRLLTADMWWRTFPERAHTVTAGGTLHLFTNDIVHGVDPDTGELLWTAPIDPDRFKELGHPVQAGDHLLLTARESWGEDGGWVYRLAPGEPRPEWELLDVPCSFGCMPLTDGASRALFHGSRNTGEGRDTRWTFFDLTEGEVLWTLTLDGTGQSLGLLAGDRIYRYVPPEREEGTPARIEVFDTADGSPLADRDLPEGVFSEPAVRTASGDLLLTPDGCVDAYCKEGRVAVADGDTGEVRWDRPVDAGFLAFDEDGDDALLHLYDGHRWTALDTATGDEVAGAEPVETPVGAFDATPKGEAVEGNREFFGLDHAMELTGPGVPEGTVLPTGTAVGAQHLADHRTPDGAVVALFLGCAPDGVRPARLDAPVPLQECVAPRLFAIDYGV